MTGKAAGGAGAFAWLYVLRLGGAGAAFLATALAARVLGPESFGVFALMIVIARLTWELVGPALDTAAVRFGARALASDDEDADEYFRYVTRLKLIVAAIALVIGVVVALPLARTVFDGLDAPVWAIVIAFICGALLLHFSSALAIFQAQQKFTRLAGLEAAHSVIRLTVYAMGLIALPAVGLMMLKSPAGLIVLHTSASAAVCVIAWVMAPRGIFRGAVSSDVSRNVHAFTPWIVAACAATSLSQAADMFILAAIDAPVESLGYYRAAVQLVLVGELAMTTLFQVLLPKASELKPDQWGEFLRRNQLRAIGLSCIGLVGIPIAPFIVRIVFGEAYGPTGVIFAVLIVGMAFVLTSAPAGAVLYAAERPRVIALLEASKFILIAVGGTWAALNYGAIGMAVAVAGARSIIAVATFIAARRAVREVL